MTPSWREQARLALELAVNDDLPAATDVLAALAGAHGLRGVLRAVQAWLDTVLEARGVTMGASAGVRLGFVELETGELTDADQAPPRQVWAGRLLAARAADDEAAFRALIDSVPDRDELGHRVNAVLAMCALNLRHTPTPGRRAGGSTR